ncbi:MAG: hypothetical protein MUO96_04230 [Actinobacteria bacterium]|nr:hypothetical protein [Actinomycetota bacterium]
MAEAKNRHGCLMAWLVLIIIVNSLTTLSYLIYTFGRGMITQVLQSQTFQSQMPQSQMLQIQMLLDIPVWVFSLLIALSIFNVVCAIALLLWKKWGFWGYCATSVTALVINLLFVSRGIGPVLVSVLTGLLGVLVLFGVLHIGDKENKGWPQLK